MHIRQEGEWNVYESDNRKMQVRISQDTNVDFNQIWGQKELEVQIEASFKEWERIAREAEADAKNSANNNLR
jgi:hypothetical protein